MTMIGRDNGGIEGHYGMDKNHLWVHDSVTGKSSWTRGLQRIIKTSLGKSKGRSHTLTVNVSQADGKSSAQVGLVYIEVARTGVDRAPTITQKTHCGGQSNVD